MYETPCEDVGDLLPFSKRILYRKVHECRACINDRALGELVAITDSFTNIAPLAPEPTNTVVPKGFILYKYKAHAAYTGTKNPRYANRGDAPTMTHAARDTKTLAQRANHNQIRAIAGRGWR